MVNITNTKCCPYISPPYISPPPMYKPTKYNEYKPRLIFGGLRYVGME